MTRAVSYYRTSSATNVGGDSDVRQRDAVTTYAAANGITIDGEFYDAAVSGADPVETRRQYSEMLAYCEANDIKMILVENATRFARDLMVQEVGYAALTKAGIQLIAVDSPDSFTSDTPTAIMIRQILGAVAQFEKAALVAKLAGARQRASQAAGHRVEGRKRNEALYAAVKTMRTQDPSLSQRKMAARLAVLGFTTASGKPIAVSNVQAALAA